MLRGTLVRMELPYDCRQGTECVCLKGAIAEIGVKAEVGEPSRLLLRKNALGGRWFLSFTSVRSLNPSMLLSAKGALDSTYSAFVWDMARRARLRTSGKYEQSPSTA